MDDNRASNESYLERLQDSKVESLFAIFTHRNSII